MKIVIDTNVVISGVFFGGYPRSVLDAVLDGKTSAYVTAEIASEYVEIVQEMIERKQGHFQKELFAVLLGKMELVALSSKVCN